MRAPAPADSGGSLPALGLGGDHLGWAAFLGERPSWRSLVGLGSLLGAKLTITPMIKRSKFWGDSLSSCSSSMACRKGFVSFF